MPDGRDYEQREWGQRQEEKSNYEFEFTLNGIPPDKKVFDIEYEGFKNGTTLIVSYTIGYNKIQIYGLRIEQPLAKEHHGHGAAGSGISDFMGVGKPGFGRGAITTKSVYFSFTDYGVKCKPLPIVKIGKLCRLYVRNLHESDRDLKNLRFDACELHANGIRYTIDPIEYSIENMLLEAKCTIDESTHVPANTPNNAPVRAPAHAPKNASNTSTIYKKLKDKLDKEMPGFKIKVHAAPGKEEDTIQIEINGGKYGNSGPYFHYSKGKLTTRQKGLDEDHKNKLIESLKEVFPDHNHTGGRRRTYRKRSNKSRRQKS